MEKEKALLLGILNVRRLENRFGSVTCFDAPEAYAEMEKLHDENRWLAEEISSEVEGVSKNGIYRVYEDIAKDLDVIYHMTPEDVQAGLEEGFIRFEIMSLHDFLEEYVLQENENPLFLELFWYSDIKTRTEFLKERFLCDLDIYYSTFLDYLVWCEVDEEAYASWKHAKAA